jgi:hypothetical protein
MPFGPGTSTFQRTTIQLPGAGWAGSFETRCAWARSFVAAGAATAAASTSTAAIRLITSTGGSSPRRVTFGPAT